jgi:hypothetical protein
MKIKIRFMKKIISLICAILLSVSACKKEPLKTEEKISPENFLSSGKYERLVIEIVYEKGYALSTETKNQLQNFLSARLNKPKGIIFNEREISYQGKPIINIGDIFNIERQFRTNFSKGNTLAVFVFSSGSDYAGNAGSAKTLGMAYGSTSIVLFEKTMHSYSGGLIQPPRPILETTVSEHEFGHLMGLVDNGTNMAQYHRDVEHGHHCDKKDCLMYYTAETSDIVSNLLGGEVPALENFCVKDLQNNGGK